jgi:hypothetical protein
MYVPAHFAMDEAEVHDLLTQHGAADLVTVTSAPSSAVPGRREVMADGAGSQR